MKSTISYVISINLDSIHGNEDSPCRPMHKFPRYIRFKKISWDPWKRVGRKGSSPLSTGKSPRKSNAGWLIYRFYGVTFPKWNIFGKEGRRERGACVKSTKRGEGCLGFKSIIVPYSRASPSNAIDFLRPPCENYLAEFTLFRGKPSWKSMKLRHVRGQDIRHSTPRTGENWRERERG